MALVLNKFKYVDEKSYSNMLRLYLLVLTLPWTQQHLLSPDDYCALSTTCVHDGVKICARSPECGTRRAFLDLCDMYEYNCDYKTHFKKLLCDVIDSEKCLCGEANTKKTNGDDIPVTEPLTDPVTTTKSCKTRTTKQATQALRHPRFCDKCDKSRKTTKLRQKKKSSYN
ncbi:uncharacterized protein LOC126380643 isoform X3 [Pectinophora gossypiella]|uniref:uncharacterized protein LOC126380643 isoform X3 n=1 Tax=Pectinophora gossypiella TaxID=13191 RepID=UPI00214E5EF9|nr:uncharacterized protein LOC126380643 isoform X3 [Pectinophora gossypiella]